MTRQHRPTRKALGIVLRTFRENRGLSQEALGYKADLHRNYIGGVERGERNPSFESLGRWLDCVGVSWKEFGEALERQSNR
jgi:transcriptional regulator with XRE-family HTH domain